MPSSSLIIKLHISLKSHTTQVLPRAYQCRVKESARSLIRGPKLHLIVQHLFVGSSDITWPCGSVNYPLSWCNTLHQRFWFLQPSNTTTATTTIPCNNITNTIMACSNISLQLEHDVDPIHLHLLHLVTIDPTQKLTIRHTHKHRRSLRIRPGQWDSGSEQPHDEEPNPYLQKQNSNFLNLNQWLPPPPSPTRPPPALPPVRTGVIVAGLLLAGIRRGIWFSGRTTRPWWSVVTPQTVPKRIVRRIWESKTTEGVVEGGKGNPRICAGKWLVGF